MKISRLNGSMLYYLSGRHIIQASRIFKHEDDEFFLKLSLPPFQRTSARFFGSFNPFSEAAKKKRGERIAADLKRGPFSDIYEFKVHRGKIAMADKSVIPATDSVKFPSVEVNRVDGRSFTLPISLNENDAAETPKVSLLCLSFVGVAKPMIDSWVTPFLHTYGDSKDIHLYEVTIIDRMYLYTFPLKQLFLWCMKKSDPKLTKGVVKRQIVYAFGDKFEFKKKLKIETRLTAYMFLVDKFCRIRWRGFGTATSDEVSSFLVCTSQLLQENGGDDSSSLHN